MTAKNKIRALFITTDYPPEIGGLQTYSFRIAKSLPKEILNHVLVGRDVPDIELPLPQEGVGFSSHRGRTRLRAFGWSLWYIPIFKFKNKINVQIHMQWSTAFPSFLLKKIGFKAKYIVLVHGAELLDPGQWWIRYLKSIILKNANAVIAGSHHTSEILGQQNIRCQKLEVIPYGNPLEGEIEYEQFERNPDPGEVIPKLLCMHRLVPRKGTDLLIETLAELKDRPWKLDIIGVGIEENTLRAKVQTLGLKDRIHFHPPVSTREKMQRMVDASLFILPSLPPNGNNHFEGLGLTLLEAQSLGTPVLASRTGGIPEAVQEGITGILFRAGDKADLRSKLVSLLRSPEKRQNLGKAGPGWVKDHFNWEKALTRLTEVLEECF